MTQHLSRFLLAGFFAAAMIPGIHAQTHDAQDRDRDRGGNWDRAHQIANRTMEDLRHIERRESFAGEDRDRYTRALRALGDFDHSVAEGRFDKGRLDDAIEQVDHVTRSRMLDPRERDQVQDDLRDLRRLREEWRG
jgi:hypothetical protein